MYYRRKLLLNILNIFGGELAKTDLQKIIFIFNQRNDSISHDFFPYKFGAFSYVLNDDCYQLERLGYVCVEDKIRLQRKAVDVNVKPSEMEALQLLKLEIGNSKGEKLLKKTYEEFPYFAINSEVGTKYLSKEVIEKAKRNLRTRGTLLTLGYEGLSIDAYLNKLIYHNVQILIDVRKNPISRKFGFSKTKLETYVTRLGIEYLHLPQLGISSELRKNLKNKETYDNLFSHYEKYILPEQEQVLDSVQSLLSSGKRVALTCFEAEYKMCHRHKIVEYLESHKLKEPVLHL